MTMNLRTEPNLWWTWMIRLDHHQEWNLRLSQRWTHVDTLKRSIQNEVRQKTELLSQQHQRTHTQPLQSTHTHPPEYHVILCSEFAVLDSAFVLGARGQPRTHRSAFGGKLDSLSKFCVSYWAISSLIWESNPVTRRWKFIKAIGIIGERSVSLFLVFPVDLMFLSLQPEIFHYSCRRFVRGCSCEWEQRLCGL